MPSISLAVSLRGQLLSGARIFDPATLFSAGEQGVWYDPSDVANLDWRVNLLQWTQEFDNPLWQKQTGTTVTANTQTAPDGTLTADTVTATAGNQVFQSGVSVLSGSSYAVSFSIRKTTGATVFPLISLESGTAAGQVILNTNTGIANVRAGVPGAANLSVASQGDYWRLSYSTTLNGSTAGVSFYPAASTDGINYFGGLSGSQVIWGAQLELGSVATDYQPITTVDAGTIARFPNATLYQDVAGTIPVTDPGQTPAQTVALLLDKSRGLALGSDIVVNGSFASGTGWFGQAGWVISGGTANGTAVTGYLYQLTASVVLNRYYEVTFTISNYVSGSVRAYLGATPTLGTSVSANGTYTQRFAPTINGNELGIAGFTFTGSIDNISVREVLGNHATQGTIASRPTYGVVPQGGRRNLLLWSEDYSNAAWDKYGVTVSGSVITATSVSFSYVAQLSNTAITAATHTLSAKVKAGTSSVFWIYYDSSAASGTAYFDLSDQSTQIVAGSSRSPSGLTITNLGGGDYRISAQWLTAVGNPTWGVGISNAKGSLTSTVGRTGTIYNAQAELGSTATPYQKVTTQYDVTEAGVQSCSYLFFDGGSDSMVSSTITPGIDKAQVFAGVRKLSDATGMLAELSADLNGSAGSFFFTAPDNSSNRYASSSRGSAPAAIGQAASTGLSGAPPDTAVLTATHDIAGDLSTIRRNLVAGNSGTGDKGTGNFLAYPLYVGARAGTSFPFNGQLFGLITRFGTTLTPQQITATEQWLAPKSTFFRPVITGVPTVGVS